MPLSTFFLARLLEPQFAGLDGARLESLPRLVGLLDHFLGLGGAEELLVVAKRVERLVIRGLETRARLKKSQGAHIAIVAIVVHVMSNQT